MSATRSAAISGGREGAAAHTRTHTPARLQRPGAPSGQGRQARGAEGWAVTWYAVISCGNSITIRDVSATNCSTSASMRSAAGAQSAGRQAGAVGGEHLPMRHVRFWGGAMAIGGVQGEPGRPDPPVALSRGLHSASAIALSTSWGSTGSEAGVPDAPAAPAGCSSRKHVAASSAGARPAGASPLDVLRHGHARQGCPAIAPLARPASTPGGPGRG